MWHVEAIGICSTIIILISMSINTSSWKGDVWMRITNIIGSIIFVVYGALLPAISTAILNGLLVIVNSYHLIKLFKLKNKNDFQTDSQIKTEENETDKIQD